MERAGDFLGVTLRKIKDPAAATAWLAARWPTLVGGTLAAHLRLVDYTKGILRVEADSREWKNQAEAMEQQLRERVNKGWRGTLVRELHIELSRQGGRLPYELDNNHVPFVRKRAKP
jgi:predicted nucleic acid-binding Zn ribbon protein